MTAIVGVCDGPRVWMGSDSLCVYGDTVLHHGCKVDSIGKCIFGFAGSVRSSDIAKHFMASPAPYDSESDEEYVVKRVVPALKSAFESNGFATEYEGRKYGGTCLVAYRKSLFLISEGYGVVPAEYLSIGSGGEVAMGSLHTTIGKKPIERIRKALSASAAHSIGVRAPFYIMSTEDSHAVEIS